MNARQKAKKLKKELEDLKADKTNGFMWLKIDGIGIVKEEPQLYFNDKLAYRNQYAYEIRIGTMRMKCTPMNDEDTLIVIDSKKLDEAI